MAERGYRPKPSEMGVTPEGQRAFVGEREPQREPLRRAPCPAEDVPDWESAQMAFPSGRGDGLSVTVAIGRMGDHPLAKICPLLGVLSDLYEGKLEEGQVVLGHNCIECWHGLPETVVEKQPLLSAGEETS